MGLSILGRASRALATIVLLLGAVGIVPAQTSTFTNPGIKHQVVTTPGGYFYAISQPGLGFTNEVGKPQLPVLRSDVEVGVNDNVSIQATGIDPLEISLDSWGSALKVLPVQPSYVRLPEVEQYFVQDLVVYQSDVYILNRVARVVGERVVRNKKYVTIEVSFIDYNPVAGKIRVYRDVQVTMNLSKRGVARPDDGRYNSKRFYQGKKPSAQAPTRGIPAEGFLIITPAEYQTVLAPFVNAKMMSYNVVMATTATTGTTTASIKAYIQNAYDTWTSPPVFVMLVGDVDKVPTFTGSIPTDLYYSTVQGTDYFPDILVGRVSVSNATQLSNWVTKVLKQQANKKHSWIAGADQTALGYGLGVNAETDYCVATYFDPIGWSSLVNKVTVYGSQVITRATGDVNSGIGIVSYNGHGAWNAWIDGITWDKSTVDALTNTSYPVVFSFGCNTGEYTQGECIGESWIRAKGGGTAFVGSSVSSAWREDGYIGRGIYAAINQGVPTMGEIMNAGKHQVFLEEGATPKVQAYYEQYNLIGDPSQEILTAGIVPPPGDIIPPVTSITSPANGAVVSGTVSIQVAATDDVGVTRVEFYVDGTMAFTDNSAPYSYGWNTSGLSGNHSLVARAYDAAGNVGISSPITASIQPPPTVLTVTVSPSNLNVIVGVAVNFSVSVAGGTPDSVVYRRQGARISSTGAVTAWAVAWTPASAGTYSNTFAAYKSGLSFQSNTSTVVVTNILPPPGGCPDSVAIRNGGWNDFLDALRAILPQRKP
jgi:hypothetical protein